MAELVTDPAILDQLNALDATPSTGAAPPSAAPAGLSEVTDPDLLRQLNAPTAGLQPTLSVGFAAPPDVRNVPTAKNDLVYRGAVPIQAAPDQGAATAFGSGIQGVPIIGPALSAGVQDAAALARSYANGTAYDAEKQHVGDIVGATAALTPVVAAAPAAFGAGPSGLTQGDRERWYGWSDRR